VATTAVRGGTVVTARESLRADVFIDGGRIVRVGRAPTADQEIDATGMLVLPGCVDLHTHLATTPTWTPLDGFASGSRAAIAGGVTTVVSMVYQEDGSLRRGIERALRDAEASSCDFAFHSVVTDPTADAIAELPGMVDDGFAGLKVFMVSPRFTEKTDAYLDLYRAAARLGMTVAVHAEDRMLIERSTAALHLAGKTGVQYFPASRPVEAEVVAVRAALKNAAATRVDTYLVHISSGAALDEIRRAKAAFESRVTAETRPLYLYLTREKFDRPDGALWVGQPPLREQADVYAVWRALADGTLDTVGTDHVPYARARKLEPDLSFDKIPPGVSNLETLLPMLYSEGVRKERLSIERLVDVLATRPARIAGMTTKGEIAVGMDADLVLFDPTKTRTLRASELHSACDYDPYEGWEVTGWPRTVLLRGEVAYDKGEIRAAAGSGRLVRRSASS
jgi:dihydropyrimidinase